MRNSLYGFPSGMNIQQRPISFGGNNKYNAYRNIDYSKK